LKKIDLHIHTVRTISDSAFVFSLDAFKAYVEHARLDAVAVTNHDVFDADQFRTIQKALGIAVFPGIEINVHSGHVLIIGEINDIDDFASKAALVTKKITKIGDSVSVDELRRIYGDLGRYLVIPHYDKAPPITGETLQSIMPFVCAGEVDSAKKFVRAIRDDAKLTPVLFSDCRIRVGTKEFPTRQTFVNCGELSIAALKACLRDKSKVSLSENDGNRLWQVFEDGQQLSTGLNVLVGSRSSGKTHTLDAIAETVECAKYIKQFALVQQDEAKYEREFAHRVESERSILADEHLSAFKRVLEGTINIDLTANENVVGGYIETLLKAAEESDRRDAYSKAALFDEDEFPIGKTKALLDLIESVRHVIENVEFRPVVERHVDVRSLKALACELIELLWQRSQEAAEKSVVNAVVKDIKKLLRLRSSATQVADIDLYQISMDAKRVARFEEIVEALKRETVIFDESIQTFRIEARREPYTGAGELKAASGTKAAFAEAFGRYDSPYKYLRELLKIEAMSHADLYRLFVKINYRILNEDGFEVSGGERSEFRLLQEIADAQNYDILLIDEPESSFDNLFLKSDVNQLLKDIARTMPVVVVTHNSTVGGSVGGDFILYTKKELENGKAVYRIYSGYPTDKQLVSTDGRTLGTHDVVLDSLEAGAETYEKRRQIYEATKR
jgi:ABC-type dipeptide/oligopeptide/nickel transport system ATPase component